MPALNAAVPFGVPSPVGPSQPAPAWQSTAGVQAPLLPLTTSNRLPVCDHGNEAGEEVAAGAPASAYTDAMIGEEALVPPKT